MYSYAKLGLVQGFVLNWLWALAGITNFYSLMRRCLGEERLIRSAEAPRWCCSPHRPRDEIKTEEFYRWTSTDEASTSQWAFTKAWLGMNPHLAPLEWGSLFSSLALSNSFLFAFYTFTIVTDPLPPSIFLFWAPWSQDCSFHFHPYSIHLFWL